MNWCSYATKLSRTVFAILVVLPTWVGTSQIISAQEKQNVLFIAVDDLNHWVGHLGRNAQAKTPNIDRLAARGVTFTNAHCPAPVCNPSRAALISGRRPSTTGIYDNGIPFSTVLDSNDSLFTQFKKSGYETLAMGKLWHGGVGFMEQWTSTGGKERETISPEQLQDRSIGGIRFGIVHADDSAIVDTATTDFGIEQLRRKHDKPFLLALGFHKPHMPWNVPKKYFDLHPLDRIELPPTKLNDLDDVPPAGVQFAKPKGDHAAVLESGRWKEAVQAYLAAISYLDGQIGRVLDALDQSPERDNTIVVFFGDHGWHLGEKEHWRKFALWEESTRAPFIWIAPGITKQGTRCSQPVDFMSIYPTLVDLASVPDPGNLEGRSIRPLLANPDAAWDGAALTTFGQNNHAVRDARWRYIRYADGSEELYDHQSDPLEWTNVAAAPENQVIKTRLATFFPTKNVEPAEERSNKDRKEKKSK